MKNISIVICCHNSASRLPQTLLHLAQQSVSNDVQWEIILVDNASTDSTATIASDLWVDKSISLRVVSEPKLGLNNARVKGVAEANYEIVCFVDDDNWVCPNWVQTISEIMTQYPDVGACGGYIEAVSDTKIPKWFSTFQQYYAVGAQSEQTGDVTWTRGVLWGAGLAIRKSAWFSLFDSGFHLLCEDRKGESLSSCGDSELCLALRSMGWKLWYDSRLTMKHFIPSQRLTWEYLRRLFRGLGQSSVIGNTPYFLNVNSSKLKHRLQCTWQWQTISILKSLLLLIDRVILSVFYPQEGVEKVLKVENLLGRLFGLLQNRSLFSQKINQIKLLAKVDENIYRSTSLKES